jgi:UDP-glucose 4-epimerase
MDPFTNKTILVVGGAGFVGSNLIKRLLIDRPAQIVVVDNLLSSERDNLPDDPTVRFLEGSIADDRLLVMLKDTFEYVFHLATYHGNQSSIHDPLADHENNTLTTLKLFERIKTFSKLRKVVYSSAGCTVAEKTFDLAKPTTEDAPVSLYLDSPYQISKVIGEMYANYYFMQHQLPVVKARFQNVYGPGEILGAGKWRGTPATVWRNVTPTFIYRAIRHMPLIVENGAEATRDFIYVDDIVRGLCLCATDGTPGEVYNLASGIETPIMELAASINRMTSNTAPIELRPSRPWDHSGRRFGSVEKARLKLGFEARESIERGLRRTIEWTQENLAVIDACIRRHREHMPDLPV